MPKIMLNNREYSGGSSANIDITTTIDENSTDKQVVSAKAVYDKLQNKLGIKTIEATDNDLNNALETGFYKILPEAAVNPTKNNPASNCWGVCQVIRYDAITYQIAYSYKSTALIHYRNYLNGVWSDWQRLLVEKDVVNNLVSYSRLAQIGLSGGNTVQEVFMAMPEASILEIGVSDYAEVTDVPAPNGILMIHKRTNGRFSIEFKRSMLNSVGENELYIGQLVGTDGSGLTWTKMITENSVGNYISNPNLLINPDFKINQRGKGEYGSVDGYTVDRWVTIDDGNANLKPTDNGVVLNGKLWLFQTVELPSLLGKTCTATVHTSIGDMVFTEVFPSVDAQATSNVGIDGKIIVYLECGANLPRLVIRKLVDEEITIYSAKLEVGSVATSFVAPDPTTELMKCQRYFELVNIYRLSGFAYTPNGDLRMRVPMKTTKRVAPTVTRTDNGANGDIVASGVSEKGVVDNIALKLGNIYTDKEKITFNTITNGADLETYGKNIMFSTLSNFTYSADAEIY